MAANKEKIAKNAIALYFRMVVVLLVSLYTARVVLQQLGASDYGIYNVVGGVITMLNFMTGALSQGIQRFYNYYKGKGDYLSINKVFWAGLVTMSIVGFIIVAIAESAGIWFLNYQMNIPADRIDAANCVFQISLISLLFGLVIVPFNAMIVSHEDFGIYAYLSIGQALLNLGFSFLLMASSYDKLIFYSVLMCLLHIAYSGTIYAICKIRYKNIRIFIHKEADIYRSLMSFSGWNILGTSMYMLGTQGVNVILNIFFGTLVNAARGIAVQISTKVDEFINNIQQAMNPQIVQLYAKGELSEVQKLLEDNFRWNFALYWIIALPLLFEIEYVLEIWLGKVPDYTSVFTFIIVLRSLLKCFERPINAVNFAIGRMKWLNLFATFSVLLTTVLMCILFIVGFPPYWAFLLDCCSIICCIAFYMSHAHRYGVFSFRNFVIKILWPIILVMCITVLLTYLFRMLTLDGFLHFVYSVCVTTILSSFSLGYILFTKENRKKISNVVLSKIRRGNKWSHG